MRDDWALVVGINKYPLAGVKPLEGAVGDARRFHKWLVDAKGGDVSVEGHITLLTSPSDEENPGGPPVPVQSQIRAFFEQFVTSVKPQVGRRLYIYLSGHGISAGSQQSIHNTALLMANAKRPNPLLNFPGSNWAEGARGAAHFREVVLIMDCCRDIESGAVVEAYPFGDPVQDGAACRLVMAYATHWASKARELAFTDENDGKKQGAFTRSLLAVLKSGRMNASLLGRSVVGHLTLALKDHRKAQTCQILGSPTDGDLDKVVFNEAADPPRTRVEITGHPERPLVIESWPEGSDRSVPVVLQGWSREGGTWRGTLEPGQYVVRQPRADVRLHVLAGVPAEKDLAP